MESIEDLLPVLKQMQELCPTNDTGETTYAFSFFKDWDDNMGTSLVLINTSRGIDAIEQLGLNKISVDFGDAIQYNESWRESACIKQERESFFKKYSKTKIDYDDYLQDKVDMHYLRKYLKRHIKNIYRKLKNAVGK